MKYEIYTKGLENLIFGSLFVLVGLPGVFIKYGGEISSAVIFCMSAMFIASGISIIGIKIKRKNK